MSITASRDETYSRILDAVDYITRYQDENGELAKLVPWEFDREATSGDLTLHYNAQGSKTLLRPPTDLYTVTVAVDNSGTTVYHARYPTSVTAAIGDHEHEPDIGTYTPGSWEDELRHWYARVRNDTR